MALCVVCSVLFGVSCLDAQLFLVCWWFEWLRAVRAVEIPSPVFSLGCPVGDAQLVSCLVEVVSLGIVIFVAWG